MYLQPNFRNVLFLDDKPLKSILFDIGFYKNEIKKYFGKGELVLKYLGIEKCVKYKKLKIDFSPSLD